MITRPTLPPRKGYVEREAADGTRYYAPTQETADAEALAAENTKLKAQLKLQSEQQTFLEDCILEMADVVYA
jgi:hypothetical protein|nr:MAG TPA_asm: hypothetical protein [Caudoviricetes sp.]